MVYCPAHTWPSPEHPKPITHPLQASASQSLKNRLVQTISKNTFSSAILGHPLGSPGTHKSRTFKACPMQTSAPAMVKNMASLVLLMISGMLSSLEMKRLIYRGVGKGASIPAAITPAAHHMGPCQFLNRPSSSHHWAFAHTLSSLCGILFSTLSPS